MRKKLVRANGFFTDLVLRYLLQRVLRFDLNSCMSVPKHYTDSDLEWLIKEAAGAQARVYKVIMSGHDMGCQPAGKKVSDGYSVFRVRGDFPKPQAQNTLLPTSHLPDIARCCEHLIAFGNQGAPWKTTTRS